MNKLKPLAEWDEFKGEYEKQFYHIELKNGYILGNCWPNANQFYCQAGVPYPAWDVKRFTPAGDGTPNDDQLVGIFQLGFSMAEVAALAGIDREDVEERIRNVFIRRCR